MFRYKSQHLRIVSIILLFIGLLVYTLFRSENIILFDWYKYFGVLKYIENIRSIISFRLPFHAASSLPYTLWVLSLGLFLLSIWQNMLTLKIKITLFLLNLILGVGVELLQINHIIYGTFDVIDIVYLVTGLFIYTLIIYKS